MIITKIITSDKEQIIKIPFDLKIEDTKVYIKKMGNSLYIIPFHNPWQSFLESLELFSDDFLNDRNQPEQKRVFF